MAWDEFDVIVAIRHRIKLVQEGNNCSFKHSAFNLFMDLSSEEEAEFDIVCNVTEVKPYMFEPLAKKHGEESDSDGSSDDSSDDEDLHRIGNVDWYVKTFKLFICTSVLG